MIKVFLSLILFTVIETSNGLANEWDSKSLFKNSEFIDTFGHSRLRPSIYILPGSKFRAPYMPNNFDFYAETSREYVVPSIISLNAYRDIYNNFRSNAKWDLKTLVSDVDSRRRLYESSGNWLYGHDMARQGFNLTFAKLGAGGYNQFSAWRGHWYAWKKKEENLSDYTVPFYRHLPTAFGDDPWDMMWVELGYEYYESGQHIIEFMYPAESIYLSELPYAEAQRRMNSRYPRGDPEDSEIPATQISAHAIEKERRAQEQLAQISSSRRLSDFHKSDKKLQERLAAQDKAARDFAARIEEERLKQKALDEQAREASRREADRVRAANLTAERQRQELEKKMLDGNEKEKRRRLDDEKRRKASDTTDSLANEARRRQQEEAELYNRQKGCSYGGCGGGSGGGGGGGNSNGGEAGPPIPTKP